MSEKYNIIYSPEALDDLESIYTYIAFELQARQRRIKLPIDNYVVYYLIDDSIMTVTIIRIFYAGRDIEGIINS